MKNVRLEMHSLDPDCETETSVAGAKGNKQLHNEQRMYEFHSRDLSQTEVLKQYAGHAVKEIKATCGWDTSVQINIEPEAKDKHLFCVSMSVFGLGEPIVVRKDGKNVMGILRKVRKSVMRQIHRQTEKKVSHRRKHFLKAQMAS